METVNGTSAKIDVYEIVTNLIISKLEEGVIPWFKPWTDAGIPMNAVSKRAYRGVNHLLLITLPYERHLYLTWDQIKEHGGSVKKGEHGYVVIYWPSAKQKEEDSEKEPKRYLRYYKVYNLEQCTGLPDSLFASPEQKEYKPIEECEAIIAGMPKCPSIVHKRQEAFYHAGEDYVNMPKKKSFASPELYYSTLFHELVHSTGHEHRLNRKSITDMAEFGSELYSQEELIAEIGSAFLSSFTGIGHRDMDNKVAYIHGWLDKLKGDKKFIIQASGQAQKAVDFIMNRQVPSEEEKEPSSVVTES